MDRTGFIVNDFRKAGSVNRTGFIVYDFRKAGSVKATDTQEGGTHYKDMAIQPIQFIHANNLDFLQGNVVKYVTRHKAKNGAADIRKALHYCQLILELQYAKEQA